MGEEAGVVTVTGICGARARPPLDDTMDGPPDGEEDSLSSDSNYDNAAL